MPAISRHFVLMAGGFVAALLVAGQLMAWTHLPSAAAQPGDDATQLVTAEMSEQLETSGAVVLSVSFVGDAADPAASSANALPSMVDQTALWDADPDIDVVAVLDRVVAAELVVTSQDALDELARDPRIASIVIPPYEGSFARQGEGLRGAQRATAIEASQMHAEGFRGATATVAIVDTGIDASHVDLLGAAVYEHCFQIFSSSTCADGSNEQAGAGSAPDVHGHGTDMASLIASKGTVTSIGVAPDARLEIIRVSDRSSLDLRDVLLALDHIVAERGDVQIVSLSLGSAARFSVICERELWPAFYDTVAALRARGTFVTAATGNNGDRLSQQYPACLADVHAVTGLNVAGDAVASGFNVAVSTDLAAPGSGLAVHEIPVSFGGTSDSNAIVAGCAALAVDSGRQGPEQIAGWLSSPNDVVQTPAGFDVSVLQCAPYCMGAAATVNLALAEQPTSGDDVILGTVESDRIDALAGNDIVCAGGGDDVVFAGQGDDIVDGGDGADRLWGNFGADVLHGNAGDDTLHGNAGDDDLNGESGDDRLYGYSGHDVLSGGQGNDRLHGNRDDDQLSGDSGDDLLFGYQGDDMIDGGVGHDRCRGNDGTDTITRCDG